MRVLFDTDVLLDVFLQREPHFESSAWLYDQVGREALVGLVSPMTIATVFYIGESQRSAKAATRLIRRVLSSFEVAPAGRAVVAGALELGFDDYEDAMQHEAARRAGADALVTRNVRDYEHARLSVYHPTELIPLLRKGRNL